MKSIVLRVRFSVKERLRKRLRGCGDAGMRLRYLVIISVLNGRDSFSGWRDGLFAWAAASAECGQQPGLLRGRRLPAFFPVRRPALN